MGRCMTCATALLLATLIGRASAKVFFFDSFSEDFDGRWIHSEDPSYTGKFQHAKSQGSEDPGLFVPEKAKKYGIATLLDEPVDLTKGTVVLQYDVRVQKGFDCGGAYLKFLMPQEEGWTAGKFRDSTPYSVMFGPDKCGSTNKVHFIFRHRSPHTGEHREHHLDKAPAPRTEWVSHAYTAIINHANNSVKILVNGEEAANGDLMSYHDFNPPVLLPRTIKDPDDKKPQDWDERPKIADPAAQKPEDWDEDAPREIPNEAAKKPEGWLDDEPLEVDDPEAAKPDDWDDEEDGEWEPPRVPNPRCREAPGCGEWKRPMKKNPAYRGKWQAPLIENPGFRGIWKARDIPNPEFVELERPALEPIAAVGIEIWTMTEEVVFDNVLITDSVEEAKEHLQRHWRPKHNTEQELMKQRQKKEEEKRREQEPKLGFKAKLFGRLYALTDAPLLKAYSAQLKSLVARGEENEYLTYAVLVSVVFLLPMLCLVLLLVPRRRPAVAAEVSVEKAKKEDISAPDDNPSEAKPEGEAGAEKAESNGDATQESETVRRRTRRDT